MKRLRYSAAPQEAQNINDEEQSLPIALLRFLRHWDILQIATFDDLAYEDTVVFLIQHLDPKSNLNDVERLLFQYFTEQTNSDTFSVEICLLIKLLAGDVFESFRDYLARNNPRAFTTPNSNAHARARGLLGRHYSPRSSTR